MIVTTLSAGTLTALLTICAIARKRLVHATRKARLAVVALILVTLAVFVLACLYDVSMTSGGIVEWLSGATNDVTDRVRLGYFWSFASESLHGLACMLSPELAAAAWIGAIAIWRA